MKATLFSDGDECTPSDCLSKVYVTRTSPSASEAIQNTRNRALYRQGSGNVSSWKALRSSTGRLLRKLQPIYFHPGNTSAKVTLAMSSRELAWYDASSVSNIIIWKYAPREKFGAENRTMYGKGQMNRRRLCRRAQWPLHPFFRESAHGL